MLDLARRDELKSMICRVHSYDKIVPSDNLFWMDRRNSWMAEIADILPISLTAPPVLDKTKIWFEKWP